MPGESPAFAFDADAWGHARSLGLIRLLAEAASLPEPRLSLHLTGYVARNELSSLQDELRELESRRALTVHRLEAGTPAFEAFKKLFKKHRDKGESELLGWRSLTDISAMLILCDRGARRLADAERIAWIDLSELCVQLVRNGALNSDAVSECLRPWEMNVHDGRCRPKDWTSFQAALGAR